MPSQIPTIDQSALKPKWPTAASEAHSLLAKWKKLQLTALDLPLDDIRFLMESDIAYWMACFAHSHQDEPFCLLEDGQIAMKVTGTWRAIADVRCELSYDLEQERLVTTKDPCVHWSYIAQKGLIPRDRFSYEELAPVSVMNSKEYSQLLQHATTFWSHHPEVDPDEEKQCILQVITTCDSHSDHWATENLYAAYPEHATFRLITPNSTSSSAIYSFGLELDIKERDAIFAADWPFPLTFFTTAKAHISTPDYRESRPFYEKRITSIPITKNRLTDILGFVSSKNKLGVSFNFARQNCQTLAREMLRIAGCSVPERWSAGKAIASMLPFWEKVPVVGRALAAVVEAIKEVVAKVLEWIPPPVTYIPRKVVALCQNSLVWLFGGGMATNSDQIAQEDELDNKSRLTTFSRLIRTFDDLLREDLADIDPHMALVEWQKRQSSTVIVRYDGQPKMFGLGVEARGGDVHGGIQRKGAKTQRCKESEAKGKEREEERGVEACGGDVYGGIQRKGAKTQRCKESEAKEEEREE